MNSVDNAFPKNASSPFASWRGNHVGIRVPDFEAAAAWYTHKLDFRLVRTMQLGEKTLAFLAPASDDSFLIEFIAGPGCTERPSYEQLIHTHRVGGWHHLCMRVANVDLAIEELKRRGVRIVSEARDAPRMDVRFAFFSDPWGNLIEISHPILQ
ncbi:VOC family protein [Undibacterium sp. RTI2.1]|uniref:VOC family protein n=1 Tax=unclassified Undibacterium TaxID=2630295 RepID=UPI002AB3A306|nr:MULTISPECIES: VOC family protein [unclassified Undibacterium]MDY7537237.1 VOC family protein [Undibacterium sp. 5I1]MEB0033083.1 VOC family protein [Undibacterium sp. RTI2.1]MEB0118903.1 VOC family protein [Undibacterium sp. RTI2.2]MEB0230349.1 VOC family protein [Undibacterium sp. 10I3]MEB0258141.1 VOC family protein [Undibacterium sp. 5I1]